MVCTKLFGMDHYNFVMTMLQRTRREIEHRLNIFLAINVVHMAFIYSSLELYDIPSQTAPKQYAYLVSKHSHLRFKL